MPWNTYPGAIPGAITGTSAPKLAPAPAPAPSFDSNKSLPGNSGGAPPAPSSPAPSPGSTSPGGGSTTPAGPPPGGNGSEVSVVGTQLLLQSAQQAAYQAYLNAKLGQDSEQVAINKAIAEANKVYQEKSIELETKKLGEQQTARLATGAQSVAQLGVARANAYNTAQGQFERTGVATGGRIGGLNALRAPLPAAAYASMLGLDAGDPRVATIAQAANTLGGGLVSPLSGMASNGMNGTGG